MGTRLVTDANDLYIKASFREDNDYLIDSNKVFSSITSSIIAVINAEPDPPTLDGFLFDKAYYSFSTAKSWLRDINNKIWDLYQLSNKAKHTVFLRSDQITEESIKNLSDNAISSLSEKINALWVVASKGAKVSKERIWEAYKLIRRERIKRKINDNTLAIDKVRTLSKLQLGCSLNKEPGVLGIDKRSGLADMVIDIEKKGLPFINDSFDIVIAKDYLQYVQDKVFIIENIYRVLKHNGEFRFIVPSAENREMVADPFVKSFWNEQSFLYFTGTKKNNFYDIKARFDILDMKYVYPKGDRNKLLSGILRAIK